MRKTITLILAVLLLAVLLLAAQVCAAEVDQHATVSGMGKSWYQGYEPAISGNTMTLYLPIRAENCKGPITVSIALDDPNVFLLAGNPKAVAVSPKNGIYPVKLSLALERHRRNGDYPAAITIRGTDGHGGEIEETISYVIRIRDGYDSHETMEPVISDVIGALDVGSEGSLTLTVTNPTTTQSILDGEITVTDPSGEILMSGSNRVKVQEVLPGKTVTVTIPMIVSGNASVTQHVLEVQFRYSCLGRDGEWTESFTVPVTQAIRLEHGAVQVPPAIAGELGDLNLPLMNMGKGELQNVLVKLEVNGVMDTQSVLVGTMAPGETKQAKLTFMPSLNSVGTHPGTVTITCEDAYGNAFTQTLDVALTVDEPIPEVELQQEDEREKLSPGTVVLMVLCVALTTALVIQGSLLTKKIHKLEEDRL